MQSIHHHYDQLNTTEKGFVDGVFGRATMFTAAEKAGIPLRGDDTIERAVDALARAVIESRKPAVGKFEQTAIDVVECLEESGQDFANILVRKMTEGGVVLPDFTRALTNAQRPFARKAKP